MESITNLIESIPKAERLSQEEYDRQNIEWINSIPGSLKGYDCDNCLNRGYTAVFSPYGKVTRECECMKVRYSIRLIEKSGLKPLMDRYTLDNFRTDEQWQKNIKAKAVMFLADWKDKWFAVLGQVGCGKTHICSAIAGELLKTCMPVYYMLWNTDVKKLRATVNDGEAHEREVKRLQTIDVLYIDDLFKCKRNSEPSDADVKLAFEILNARYNAQLTTLISSEFNIDELSDIDTAIAGRINQMCGSFLTNIARKASRDYRWNTTIGE